MFSQKLNQYLGHTFLYHPTMFKVFLREEGNWISTLHMHNACQIKIISITHTPFYKAQSRETCVCVCVRVCSFLLTSKKQILIILPSLASQLPIPTILHQALAFKSFQLRPRVTYLCPNSIYRYTANTPHLNENQVFKCVMHSNQD